MSRAMAIRERARVNRRSAARVARARLEKRRE